MTTKAISTYVLLLINTVVFSWLAIQQQSLMMDRGIDVIAILHAGGNFNPFTLNGEPWRLITSMFLHFGVLHLLVNMFALYSMGRPLEVALGTPRFLLVYFFCGIAGGLVSTAFNMYTISAGASGALFGLYGYRLGAELVGNYRDRHALGGIVVNFIIFVVINAFITSQFNVDLAGHIGGCIGGLVLAVVQHKFDFLNRKRELAVAVLLLSFGVFLLPKDKLYYYQIFQRVLTAERRTTRMGNLTDLQIKDTLHAIIPEWDSIRVSLHGLKHVHPDLRGDTSNLSNYAKLRKQEALYRIALIDRESYVYLDSLDVVSVKFDSIHPFKYNLNFDFSEPAEMPVETNEGPNYQLVTKRIFYDSEWKEVDDPSASVFHRVGSVDSLGRWQGKVTDYFRNGDIQMKGKYLSNMKDGIFIYYSDHGTYSSAGRYIKEEAVGKWESYHWNGALESEVYYNGGAFTRSVWDSLGRVQVENGNGRFIKWHLNGNIAEEGDYVGGRRDGDWFGFHDDGKPYYHDFYSDNRLIRGVSEDKDGKRYVYDQLSLYPFPVMGMAEYKKYLEKNIQRDNGMNSKSGVVKVTFNVGIDGSIWDFVIIQSLSWEQDQEAIRLIQQGPPWRPGLVHGQQKIHSQGYVEVVF